MVSTNQSSGNSTLTRVRSKARVGGEAERAEPARFPLPCLSNNNSNEGRNKGLFDEELQTPSSVRKAEFVLRTEVRALAKAHGLERLGFFTLTFPKAVMNRVEASRRFNSLLTGVLRKRYKIGIRVLERHKSNGIHFHCVVVCDGDIRSGFDFAACENGKRDYSSANPYLRREWAFWRETVEKYGFGRHELKPVKSNAEGLAKYVGKYLGKHWAVRRPEDVGARLVSYWGYRGKSAAARRNAGCTFSWVNGGARIWRESLRDVDRLAGHVCPAYLEAGLDGPERLKRYFGRHWAWKLIKKEVTTKPMLAVCEIENIHASRMTYTTLPSWSARPVARPTMYFHHRSRSNPSGVTVDALASRLSAKTKGSRCNRITSEDMDEVAATMQQCRDRFRFLDAPPSPATGGFAGGAVPVHS